MMDLPDQLQRKLATLPDTPGVYLWKDAEGNILYVGKAKRLSSRVRSYFTADFAESPKNRLLRTRIADVETIVVPDEAHPLSAISLAEVLTTSDVPGGVVNVLTGSPAELAPWLASHADVNAIDLAGAGQLEWVDLEIAAADTLKRVLRPEPGVPAATLDRILAFVETKTVWHTKSLL